MESDPPKIDALTRRAYAALAREIKERLRMTPRDTIAHRQLSKDLETLRFRLSIPTREGKWVVKEKPQEYIATRQPPAIVQWAKSPE